MGVFMKRKNGFISITIIYTFFMVFLLTLMLVLASLLSARVRHNIFTKDIKETDAKQKSVTFASGLHKSMDVGEPGTDSTTGRYIGANPHNYVRFNSELWRIIGVFDMDYCLDDDCTTTESKKLVKIVRNESIGSMSFDYKQTDVGSSSYSTGSGYWPDSQIMMLLNPVQFAFKQNGYTSEGYSVKDGNGVTIYRNMGAYFQDELQALRPALTTKASGFTSTAEIEICNGSNSPCMKVLNREAQSKIATVVWKIGQYISETQCDVSPYDWVGKVGLPSNNDFFLASSTSNCSTYDAWVNNGLTHGKECYNNDWLTQMDAQWSMTFYNASGTGYQYVQYSARSTNSDGALYRTTPNKADTTLEVYNVRPVLYLKPNVKAVKGTGTEFDPYIIS